MKIVWLVVGLAVAAQAGLAAAADRDLWTDYLDYAYVYCSAEPAPLRDRLAEYGREAGVTLQRYIAREYEPVPIESQAGDEVALRRRAIAYLLAYLAHGDPDSLEQSTDAVRALEDHLERHENRYWYRYVLAHRALEKGRRFDFVTETLALWSEVVVPLESTYQTLETLSLDESANAGFAAAVPYLYENVVRLVLIRSPHMGVDRDLDPLGGIIRLLADGRVGAHPDVIPPNASSRELLERISTRLDGPESDGGSLTFTLALFEATRLHELARGRLARDGLSSETLEAFRVASGAYATALARARLAQGRVAVHVRALRLLGEIHAAKQRLNVDPEFATPFHLADAYDLYALLSAAKNEDDLKELGYAIDGRNAWRTAMRGLWEEIQEATLNMADYYLHRSVSEPHRAYEHSRAAARLYERYVSFFLENVSGSDRTGVPESAYFAAHEAARGVGDAFLLYDSHPTKGEVELALRRHRAALEIFPFDRRLWSSIASALERRGRESDYLSLVEPAAAEVTRSKTIDTWIRNGEPEAQRIAALRRACANSLALVYLGFADGSGLDELENGIAKLREERETAAQEFARLVARRDGIEAPPGPAALDETGFEPGDDATAVLDAADRTALLADIEIARGALEKIDRQLEARTRALPLYRETLATDGFADELRARRDHPAHTLLRRLYHELHG